MSFLSRCIKVSVVLAICSAGSFGGRQAYMAATAAAAPVTVSKPDLIALKLAEYTGTLSPIYPTIKYTAAQLAGPTTSVQQPKKTARRHANKMPMQIAYIPNQVVR
jgi:hypothetical protein